MKRPQTLYDVSKQVAAGDMEFGPAVREFLDTFYGSDDTKRAAIIRGRPLRLNPVRDAYLAATAEHLALQYDLEVPEWTEHQGNELDRAHFSGGLESLKAILIVESPMAFRRRLLFVSANALDRASMHADRTPLSA
ncbi:hypothetical protein D3C71_360840 [compost metagenome]